MCFFDGEPEDVNVAVNKIDPSQAEYWDNDKGSVAMAVGMTRAYFTDGGPDLGQNTKVDLDG